MDETILLADVGGTKTELSILNKENLEIVDVEIKYTSSFEKISDMILEYIQEIHSRDYVFPTIGLFAVAGNVREGLNLTNLSFEMDIENLKEKTPIVEVEVLNDLEAATYHLRDVKEKEVMNILDGNNDYGNKTLIAIGTGLGVAFDLETDNERKVMASEAGHTLFQPVTEEDIELLEFFQSELNKENINWEDIISGKGIERIYRYAVNYEEGFAENPYSLDVEHISNSKISNNAANKTFRIFYRLLGRFARMQVLENLVYGGVFLSGGVVRKNLDIGLEDFKYEFYKYDEVMEKEIPVKAIREGGDTIKGLKRYFCDFYLKN